MAFKRLNFSPVGSQSRRGSSPQQFSYISPDTLALIKANGYFPNNSSGGIENNMLGNFSPNDVISVVAESPPANLSTQTLAPELSIIRIAGDGKNAGVATVPATPSDGSNYATGDLVKVTYVNGTVLRNTILATITTTLEGAIIVDPGQFDPNDLPTTLTPLATVALDSGGGSGGTVTVTITGNPKITVWPKDINES